MFIRMTKTQWGSLARYLNAEFAKRVAQHGHSYSLARFSRELKVARPTLSRYMDETRTDVMEGMDLDILLNIHAALGDDFLQALREERSREGG